jgi:hypothetical protein
MRKYEKQLQSELTLLESDCRLFADLCCKLSSPDDFEMTAVGSQLFEENEVELEITLRTTREE